MLTSFNRLPLGKNRILRNRSLRPRFVLRVDHEMCTYLTSGKKTKLGLLSSTLKVWILLKVQFYDPPSSFVFLVMNAYIWKWLARVLTYLNASCSDR
jgi:hypothetical protein